MIPPSAGRILFWITGGGLILVGIAFLGVAIFVLLRSRIDVAGAAAITAIILLAPPIGWSLKQKLTPPPPKPAANPQTAALAALASLAREKPLLAVLGAGLLGVTEYLLRRR